MNNYSNAQLQKIVDDAPEGAEHCFFDISSDDEKKIWYYKDNGNQSFDSGQWRFINDPQFPKLLDDRLISLNDIHAELLARQFKVGNKVEPISWEHTLASGSERYTHAYVVNLAPFQLISERGDMFFNTSAKPEGFKVIDASTDLPEAVINRMAREGLISPSERKYDWSNVPDVVNWLATDKDGDCAWGFLEEPVIELEDGEWRPVAPYTEIYINGSNGTVAAYKGDWQESLEQRKFKIGDKVTFIRNIEPFQWGAKEKVYEVVDVADNLPTSTDQRVWLDTTASSPHLSRNLCLATAIGQVGIEDLPVHGEPICSEIITNSPEFDGIKTQLDNEAALFNEPLTESELVADPVNHPSHYTSDPSGIECIEITRHRNFNVGNAIKYLWRAGRKDQAATVQDLQKAIWYINDEIARLKGEQGE